AWSTITLEPTTVLDDGSYLAEISNKASRSSATRIPLASVPNSPHLATHITVRSGGRGTTEREVSSDPGSAPGRAHLIV
ncbi:MAG: hypothetical protein L0K86_29915, partial [Actinomycetia bacterium]|nr:hypothetical protein [Actinomycetes bacterium]